MECIYLSGFEAQFFCSSPATDLAPSFFMFPLQIDPQVTASNLDQIEKTESKSRQGFLDMWFM